MGIQIESISRFKNDNPADQHSYPKSMHKLFKDCIYGHIPLPPLCVAFMDTPEFQRLRRVQQLGMAHYAYPSATFTRFEHSIGVAHLASKMMDQFKRFVSRQPTPLSYSTDKLFDPRTKELVQLAGMYHDIGHFAYSHLFDTFLAKMEFTDTIPEIFTHPDHEDRSIYFLKKVNARLQLLSSTEEQFVINCILGIIPEGEPAYLYQIVCNKECGIDVDRLDYLKRDSFHCGLPGFQSDYIILNAGIGPDGNLSFREKTRQDIIDMFETRKRMHDIVYQHHTVLKVSKIYLCLMKTLGPKLFTYGEAIDDHNVDTLIRSTPELAALVLDLDCRRIDHECPNCVEFSATKRYIASGDVNRVPFI